MQLTTVILFQLDGNINKIWAFRQVPLAIRKIKKEVGLDFFKSMGTGGADGFGAWPNFGKYAWIMVWKSHLEAELFFKNSTYFKEYVTRCSNTRILYLKNIISNGKWSGLNPFLPTKNIPIDSKIVVITRANIKINMLLKFWLEVGKTAEELYRSKDLEFAVGVGELPIIQQATISIWPNMERIRSYAFESDVHKNVIFLTRKHNWYSEELFARFYLEKEINFS